MGFARQLTSDEIFEQVAKFAAELRKQNQRLSNGELFHFRVMVGIHLDITPCFLLIPIFYTAFSGSDGNGRAIGKLSQRYGSHSEDEYGTRDRSPKNHHFHCGHCAQY
jgi:hypothetical protein